MFTGIIETVGEIAQWTLSSEGGGLRIRARFSDPLAAGESVAVDGSCLTVTELGEDWFRTDVSAETLSRTAMKVWRAGRRVNLERALALGDRLGGHIVTGHIDGVGRVAERREIGSGLEIAYDAPRDLRPYIAEKGSVAVDGVSFTVSRLTETGFRVAAVPFTLEHTTAGDKRPGDEVNLETDVLSKYLERLQVGREPGRGVDLTLLAKAGYL